MATNFGRDVSCLTGLRTGRYASGARLVAEAVYRRLTTPAGSLAFLGGEDEANYGLDLADLIGAISSPAEVAALPGRIQAELLKDERISSVDAQVVAATAGPAVTWTISIAGQTSEGPFALQLSVGDVTVALLGISP